MGICCGSNQHRHTVSALQNKVGVSYSKGSGLSHCYKQKRGKKSQINVNVATTHLNSFL